jgi:hypothetical protein
MNTSLLLETNLNNDLNIEEIIKSDYFLLEIKPKSAFYDKYD